MELPLPPAPGADTHLALDFANTAIALPDASGPPLWRRQAALWRAARRGGL